MHSPNVTQAAFKHSRTWSFETLSPAPTNDQSGLNVIFAHGLKNDRRTRSRDWRVQLPTYLLGAELMTYASIHIFAFKASRLFEKGEQELNALATNIRKHIERLLSINQERSLVFISYDVARWVIQRTLASHSHFESMYLVKVVGVIFWENPSPQEWVKKNIPSFARKFISPGGPLDSAVLEKIEHDFKQLMDNPWYHPELEEVSIRIEGLLQGISQPLRKRIKLLLTRPLPSSRKNTIPLSNRDEEATNLGDSVRAVVKRNSERNRVLEVVHARDVQGRTSSYSMEQDFQQKQLTTRNDDSKMNKARQSSHNMVSGATTSKADAETRVSSGNVAAEDISGSQTNNIRRAESSWSLQMEIGQLMPQDSLSEMARIARRHLGRGDHNRAKSLYATILSNFGIRDIHRVLQILKAEATIPIDLRYSVCIGLAIMELCEGHLKSAESAFQSLIKDLQGISRLEATTRRLMLQETYSGLGQVYYEMDKHQEALNNFWEAQESAKKDFSSKAAQKASKAASSAIPKLAPSEENYLLSSCSEALVLARRGDFTRALHLSNEVLENSVIKDLLQRKVESGDEAQESEETWQSFSTLCRIRATVSYVFWLAGYRNLSMLHHKQVLAASANLFQPEHLIALNSNIFESEILLESGDIQKAELRCDKALHILHAVYGALHPSTLAAHEIQASIYLWQGRLTEARNTAEALLAWSEEQFNDKHTQTIRARDLLAVIHTARGEFGKATQYHDAATTNASALLQSIHPCPLRTLTNKAITSYRSGDLDAAIKDCWKVFLVLKRRFSDDIQLDVDQGTASCGKILELLENLQRAKYTDSPYISILCSVALCMAQCELGRISGDLAIATQLLKQIYSPEEESSIFNQPKLVQLEGRHALAMACRQGHQIESALQAFHVILQERDAILGKDHQQTLLTRFEYNLTLHRKGEKISIQSQQAIVDRLDQLLGPHHVDVVAARGDLAVMLYQLGYMQDAESLQLDVIYHQTSSVSDSDATDSEIEAAVFQTLEAIADDRTKDCIRPRTHILFAIGALAEIESDLGRYPEAIITRRALLKLATKWGCKLDAIMHMKHDLGHLLQTYASCVVDDVELSNRYMEEAKELYKEILSDQQIHTLPEWSLKCTTQINLGSIYWSKHLNSDAKAIQEDLYRYLDARPRFMNSYEEGMLVEGLNNLALAASNAGHHDEARNLLQKAANASLKASKDDKLTKALVDLRDSWIATFPKSLPSRRHDSVQQSYGRPGTL